MFLLTVISNLDSKSCITIFWVERYPLFTIDSMQNNLADLIIITIPQLLKSSIINRKCHIYFVFMPIICNFTSSPFKSSEVIKSMYIHDSGFESNFRTNTYVIFVLHSKLSHLKFYLVLKILISCSDDRLTLVQVRQGHFFQGIIFVDL